MHLNWSDTFVNLDLNFLLQILTVLFAAGIIGFERQINKKPAGIRTSILIALGSMLFVKYSIIASADVGAPNADPARVMGQVVSGIGFLGAGTIMNRQGLVAGLTTASTIWVQAAIGSIVALGYYVDAVIFALITLFVLQGVSKIEVALRLSKIKGNKIRVREGVARTPLSEEEFDV